MRKTGGPLTDGGKGPNPYLEAFRCLRGTFVLVALFSAAINILMLTGPVYMLQVYDRVLSSGSVSTLLGLFTIVVVLYGFLGLYEFLRARMLARASVRLDKLVGDDTFRFSLKSGPSGSADHGVQPVRDLGVMRSFVASPAIIGLFDIPWMPVFLVIVFLIHPWLGYLTVAGALVLVVAAVANQLLARAPIRDAMALESTEHGLIEQVRRDAEAIQALGMKETIVERWRRLHDAAMARGQVASDRSEVTTSFSKSFRMLLQSALLTLGAFLALRQEITPGMIIAVSIIAARALAPVDQVIGQWRAIGRAREAHQRLREVFDALPEEKARVQLPAPGGNLQITRLTKLAPGKQTLLGERLRILDRVTFDLAPGDGLGVIGNSAAGKSTLARLLVGAWTPDAGEVRLDGATLDQWTPEDRGRFIGYLPQSLQLMHGSVGENIARFDPDAKSEDIIEAARIAGIHDMILQLPDGYATHVSDSDQPLSGGQIQRLGLARALFGSPKLIVLDEPNSNLDSSGDDALANAIGTMRERGSVVIVMAHRPSAIAAVNKVLILHKGAAAQFGDKDDVMRTSVRPVATAAE